MEKRLYLPIAGCSECEQLLAQCLDARRVLSARREEVRRARLTGVHVGRELLALQARFAKAYSLVRKHVQECEVCRKGAMTWNRRTSDRFAVAVFDQISA